MHHINPKQNKPKRILREFLWGWSNPVIMCFALDILTLYRCPRRIEYFVEMPGITYSQLYTIRFFAQFQSFFIREVSGSLMFEIPRWGKADGWYGAAYRCFLSTSNDIFQAVIGASQFRHFALLLTNICSLDDITCPIWVQKNSLSDICQMSKQKLFRNMRLAKRTSSILSVICPDDRFCIFTCLWNFPLYNSTCCSLMFLVYISKLIIRRATVCTFDFSYWSTMQ